MDMICAYCLTILLLSSNLQVGHSSPINYFYDDGDRLRNGVNMVMQAFGFGSNNSPSPSSPNNRYRKSGIRPGRSIQNIAALRESLRKLQLLNRENGMRQVFG